MRLGDFVDLVRGNTYKSKLLSETDGPVLLGLGSIARNGGFKYGAWKHYPGESDSRILLHPGDIYVSLKDLTQACDLLGAVARVPDDIPEGRLTQDTVKLVFDNTASRKDKLYTYWSLRTPQYRSYCKGRGTGTTNMSLSRIDFLDWELPSQNASNDVLIETFEAIENLLRVNQQTNDYLYELIDSVFAEHFPCIDANGAPSIEAIDSLGFSPTVIGSLCKNVTDGTHSTVKDDQAGTCLLLSCKNVKNGALVTSDKDRRISEETLNKLRKRTGLAKGDILLTSVGTIGEMALLRTTPDNFEFQRSVALVKPDAKLVSSEFLYSYMRAIARHIRAQAYGAVQQCIFINDIKQIAAFNPGSDLIARFTEMTRPMFDLISSNEEENRSLANLRNALLPKLMSGEIDVSEIELPKPPNNHLYVG